MMFCVLQYALFYLSTCYFFCVYILIQDKCSQYIQDCIVLERKACKREIINGTLLTYIGTEFKGLGSHEYKLYQRK